MKTIKEIFCFVLAVTITVVLVTKGDEPYVPTLGELKEQLSLGFGRGIHLAGILVDENGTPLDDVTITVNRHGGLKFEKYHVNKHFDLNFAEDLSIYVSFEKEGYYSAGKVGGYIVDDEVPVGPDGIRRIAETNMVVVLRSIGGPVMRQSISSIDLKYSVNGLDFGLTIKDGGLSFEKTGFPDVFTAIPSNTVVLKPNLTPEGVISTTNWFNPSSQLYNLRAVDPAIEVTGAGNGFIRYEPQNLWPKKIGGVWREMRECPETGYTNRLIIGAHEGDIYAFFRWNGYYGKCRIITYDISRDDMTNFKAMILCIAQPDGTRNVRTPDNFY